MVPVESIGETTEITYYGKGKSPKKAKVYVHETYEYYLHFGELAVALDPHLLTIIDSIDRAFYVWNSPIKPRFMGMTDNPGEYGDGINTIDFGAIEDADGNIEFETKAVAIYDVQYVYFISEADVRLSSYSGWKELGVSVSVDGVPEINCDLYGVMAHEIGHVLGYSTHSKRPGGLMYYSGACAGGVKWPTVRELERVRKAYVWLDKLRERGLIEVQVEECTEE